MAPGAAARFLRSRMTGIFLFRCARSGTSCSTPWRLGVFGAGKLHGSCRKDVPSTGKFVTSCRMPIATDKLSHAAMQQARYAEAIVVKAGLGLAKTEA